MYKKASFSLIFSVFAGLGIIGCKQDQDIREYKEIVPLNLATPIMMPMSGMPATAQPPMGNAAVPSNAVNIKITWEKPKNWLVSDSASNMRDGSFTIPGSQPDQNIDVSVVKFPGSAGGAEANVQRWMGQIGIDPNAVNVPNLIAQSAHFHTRSGQEGILVDFTKIPSGEAAAGQSIFGAMIETEAYTVFVKGKGQTKPLIKNKASLIAFCNSLSIENLP